MVKALTEKTKRRIKFEIGDLLWRDTNELIMSAKRVAWILEMRGFRRRSGYKYDWVKYIGKNLRIHVQMKGLKGKAFYHIDFH